MVSTTSDRVESKKYYTIINGFSVYNASGIDLSKSKDYIVVQPEGCSNIMIVDHVPDVGDYSGWNTIKHIYNNQFKLISDGNPCITCKNGYKCMFEKTTALIECIEACGSLLKKQDPFPGFTYVKPGYTVDPFCIPSLYGISLYEKFISMRTKEIYEAADRGSCTKKFKQKYCTSCIFSCKYVGVGSTGGCKFTQAMLYDILDTEIKVRFGSYENAMSMLVNCGEILWINKRKYVVACPITSKYYLLRKTSSPFTLKLLESKYLDSKSVRCTKIDIMNLRTMVAYQNTVNMFLGFSQEWRVFFSGYILPMAFVDMNTKKRDLTVYCKQPSKMGRRVYYRDPEEVIHIQCSGENYNFKVLYPSYKNRSSSNAKFTPANAVNMTKRFSKNPKRYLQVWDRYTVRYKALEIINNSKFKKGGKL